MAARTDVLRQSSLKHSLPKPALPNDRSADACYVRTRTFVS